MIYLISDTHFNHKNIIAYENRPFSSIPEMNEALIRNWNEVVTDDDVVIHLGDVGLGQESQLKTIVPQLKGHKILILGNHDNRPKAFYLDCGFQYVTRTFKFNYKGIELYLSHEPVSRPGDGSHYDMHFYGHVHTKGINDNYPTISHNGACLCVERWNYYPVSLDHVIELCEKEKEVNNAI